MTFLTRVNRVAVTNTGAANTGTSLATIVNGDILILNRATTVQSTLTTDKIFIAQGLGGGAALFIDSNGIEPSQITKITHRAYAAPTEAEVEITTPTPTNSTQYRLRVLFLDDQRSAGAQRPTVRDYHFITDTSATATELGAAMAAKVNADPFMDGKIVATSDATTITLTGQAIPVHPVDQYSQYNFTASLAPVYDNVNFSSEPAATTVTGANPGSGTYGQIREMEYQASGYRGGMNRTLFPVPSGGVYATRAVEGGQYSIVTIHYFDRHTGDRQDQMQSPLKAVIAFNTSSATTKREAFLTAIATVTGKSVESPTIV